MYEEPSCGCTGIRRCGICCPGLFKETAPRRPEWGDFATPLRHYVDDVSTATKWLCRECGRLVVQTEEQYRNAGNGPQRCSEHAAVAGDAPGGLWVDPGFVSEEEEARLVAFYDATDVNNSEVTNDVELKEGDTRGEATRWVASQSGRRKCDFGPQANFKKKKCKIGDAFGARGFPQELKPLLRACSAAATAAPALNNYSSTPRPYVPVQASALDYQVATASNLDPHVDDEWVWGDRILGVCLLSTTVMTFVKRSSDDPVRDTFRLVLPQRCYFGISGDSRHAWMHAIAAADIVQRRISITIRELEETFVAEFPDLSKAVVDCASLADG